MKRQIIGLFSIVLLLGLIVVLVSDRSTTDKTPTNSTPSKQYVAFGDSVAAGEGLPTYTDSSACNRTKQSYPNLFAKASNYRIRNYSCSGATLSGGILGGQVVNDLPLESQLSALKTNEKPDLITITAGANDIQWTTILRNCAVTDCGTDSDSAEVDARLLQVKDNLATVLSRIHDMYPVNSPRVILTSYYQLLPEALPNCLEATGLTQSEVTWERAQQTKLNQTIEAATKAQAFAQYKEVDFTGHELCSADPWIQDLTAKAPFHPTEAGQTAYLKALL
ncbi:MAG: SGNH/GDSL hydrolase family protein [Patescibacteria group bacterium]|nr:SGNH/GDSL hydrolase family protein [Patescibacteria group bacterium]